jgi:CRISPR-associated protein Cas2
MLLLVIYDVSDDNKRNRLANALKRYGLSRIQKSAFKGDLDSQRLKDLLRSIKREVNEDTDVVHVVPIDPRNWDMRIVIGSEGGERRKEGAVTVV